MSVPFNEWLPVSGGLVMGQVITSRIQVAHVHGQVVLTWGNQTTTLSQAGAAHLAALLLAR